MSEGIGARLLAVAGMTGSAPCDGLADGIAVISPVRDQPGEAPGGGVDQRPGHGDIVDIAGGDQQNARPALIVGQAVELAGAATARGADGLGEGPPVAPPAERCALMWVASIATVPHTPQWPVSAPKMPSQTPCRLQRLKRL